MRSKWKQRAVKSFIGVMVAILLFFTAGIKIPGLDHKTNTYFMEAMTKAGLAYATCRAINASVSIVKESTLQLEPAGVGISLAIGQVLDPIDDMTERLSDVLVTAITALGIQKLAFEISLTLAPPIFAFFLCLLSLLIWFDSDRIAGLQKNLLRILVLIAVARFCLPISSLANDFVHHHFFADQIAQANEELALGSAELEQLKEFSLPEMDGLLGTIENSTALLKQKSIQLKDALVSTVYNMGDMIENLLKLTFLYVGIFIIQVILLPLLSFWFLVKIANSLFHQPWPVIQRHGRDKRGSEAA
jgi:hypothetical protein